MAQRDPAFQGAGVRQGGESDAVQNDHHGVGDVLGELNRPRGGVVEESGGDALAEVVPPAGLAPLLAEGLAHQAPVGEHLHAPVGRDRLSVQMQPGGDGGQIPNDLAAPLGDHPPIAGGWQTRILVPLPVPEAFRPRRGPGTEDLRHAGQDLGPIRVRPGSDLDHGRLRLRSGRGASDSYRHRDWPPG